MGAAGLSFSLGQADPTETAEGRTLSVLAAVVVACAAFASQLGRGRSGAGKWLAAPATGSVLVLACLWFLHQGPHRGGAVSLVLTATLAASLLRSWPRVRRGAYGAAIVWATSVSVGVQMLVRPDLLLRTELGDNEFWTLAVALPVVFGSLLGLVAGSLGRPPLLAGVALLLSGPGLDLPRATQLGPALLLALGAGWLWNRSGADRRWRSVAGRRPLVMAERTLAVAVLVAGALVIVLAAYPWMRAAPWSSLASLRLEQTRTAATPLDRGIVVLHADAPTWSAELSEPVGASSVVVDSSLVHGLDATGRQVATVRLRTDDGAVEEWPLIGGIDTADWAAGRQDVALSEGFRAPAAWSHSVAVGGDFFARRYRTLLRTRSGAEIRSVEIEIGPAATEDGTLRRLELHLARVELRR